MYRLYKLKEKFQLWVAWHVPRWLVYWCTIRLLAHATSGQHSNQVVPDLLAMDALKRWEKTGQLEIG
jgi:hypothetical protein